MCCHPTNEFLLCVAIPLMSSSYVAAMWWQPQVLHAQHRVIIDSWIEMRISPRTAVLFKALRHQLSEYLRARIGANVKLQAADDASAGANKDFAATLRR